MAGQGNELLIENISFTGIALQASPEIKLPGIGEILSGTIAIKDKPFEVAFNLVRVKDSIAGGRFIERYQELRNFLKSHYGPELAAMSLKKVEKLDLKPQPDGDPHWFFDGNDSELYYVMNKGRLVRFRLSFLNRYLEGKQGEKPRFGKYDAGVAGAVRHPGTRTIKNSEKIPQKEIEFLLRYVHHIQKLDEQVKHSILIGIGELDSF